MRSRRSSRTRTKQSDHAVTGSSDQKVAVVVEGHAIDSNRVGNQRQGALHTHIQTKQSSSNTSQLLSYNNHWQAIKLHLLQYFRVDAFMRSDMRLDIPQIT